MDRRQFGQKLLVLVAPLIGGCGSDAPSVGDSGPTGVAPSLDLPIQLPESARLIAPLETHPGGASWLLQATVATRAEETADFFRREFERIGMREIRVPNPVQARDKVVRLSGESQNARVVIMIVKRPLAKGSDVSILWEEPQP